MAKTFIEMFTSARRISTPLVAVRTFDALGCIKRLTNSLGAELAALTPLVSWDAICGLKGLNDAGVKEVTAMCQLGDNGQPVEVGATVDISIATAVLRNAKEDVMAFMMNPHLFWDNDKRSIQGIWNLRNDYKAAGNTLVITFGPGDELPAEIRQDTLLLEEPLPTRAELAKVITDTFAYAAQNPKYKACKGKATPEVIAKGTDALIGLPLFPSEQAIAQNLDMETGVLDVETLWNRKKDIVSQNAGLSYHTGPETLKDMYGLDSLRKFGKAFMAGKYKPTVMVRMDEIEKQFAGAGTDTSGTKGNLMGDWLTWVNDRKVVCTLLVGVPGSSKSHFCYCIGGEYGVPVINYSIPGMEDSLVGNSGKNQRTAHKVLDAISDGKIWLIATANSIGNLAPEVISRFQIGGIWFVDAPDEQERIGIMDLKIKAYNLGAQEYPDMNLWTGRDVDNCARKAEALGVPVKDAGQYIIPLLQSHREQMDYLRKTAHNRYLSANKPGPYQYTEPAGVKQTHEVRSEVVEGRKFR